MSIKQKLKLKSENKQNHNVTTQALNYVKTQFSVLKLIFQEKKIPNLS